MKTFYFPGQSSDLSMYNFTVHINESVSQRPEVGRALLHIRDRPHRGLPFGAQPLSYSVYTPGSVDGRHLFAWAVHYIRCHVSKKTLFNKMPVPLIFNSKDD